MTDCPNAEMRDRLPDLLHEQLDVRARAAVVSHVSGCAECRAELAVLRQMRASLSSGIVAIDAAAVAQAVVARTARQGAIGPHRSRWTDWRLAATLVFVLGGASVATLYATRGGRTDMASHSSLPAIATVPPAATSMPSRAPERDTGIVGSEPAAGAELAAAGDVSDLSESELRSLLGDLDTMEAVPSTEPEPVTVRVSLPSGGGTE